jgi:hypothetical protein
MRNVLLFVGILFHLTVTAQAPPKWTLKHEKDNVKVYFRQTSDVYEVKLTTSFNTNMASLTSLLLDADQYEVWGYKVSHVRMLKQLSPTDFYYYLRLDFPWPLSDRDLVLHTTVVEDPETHFIFVRSESAPDMVPVTNNIIRIRQAYTKWTLSPGHDGWVNTSYELYSNPGGSLPDWLVNLAIDVGPRETMGNIRKFLSDKRYQRVHLAYMKN